MKFRLILTVCFLFVSHVAAGGAGAILVIGDSLSTGYGIRQEQAWPSLLVKRLQEQRYTYTVANASISGDTTSGGLSRIAPALTQYKPQVVILALGANDGLRGLPVVAMRENLAAMIHAAHAAKARVVLVGMRVPPNYGPEYAQQFHQTYVELARSEKVALVPFLLEGFAAKRELFQTDGIHPAAPAQSIMLDNVWAELRPLLKR